ncbi:MAG: inositol-3-phosphate synthase [Chloroflexota bacterium]
MQKPIESTIGKLGVLVVGINGAVATTFIAGVLAVRKGLSQPIGSLTQMATIRLGKRIDNRFPRIKDFVPLSELDSIVFGGWDIRNESCYESAAYHKVLEVQDIDKVKDELDSLRPMPGVFDQKYVVRLKGEYVKEGGSKYELMEALREDIRKFKEEHKCDRLVMVWCGSTEIFLQHNAAYDSISSFEAAMKNSEDCVAPSMLYAYAALMEGVPYINGAPNLTVDIPAIIELAHKQNLPIAGKDFKTGQTMMKTVLAPMLKARMLGLSGWFSSNILGNRDGEVLDDPASFKTKEESKLSVIDSILQPELYPELYEDYYHKVRIHYYPPKGDNKESWDNINIFGWMGYPMELKINFLCRDSILAAPIVLDLVLFMDLAHRARLSGIQEWLSFYFKSPMHTPNTVPENDLFIQLMKLKNTLRVMMGEEIVSHFEAEI